ncbi:MAG TPA: hypothetical protein VHV55_16435 [Pirellulales bacterium]|jgi:hypothetical protein|nr:hypothetical protein [Pirellulales bacterium]
MPLVNAQKNVCFVVMPFGVKALNDGSGRTFDFDKIYRVLIQRAVKLAGLTPLRADEQVGSQVIHLDMFKSLRDTAIVLADLSTTNANVFYELGIRHVMSPRGTVLMCRKGTELPFDIKLSRVVFYSYDGESLDCEEAERVILELQTALEEAQRGRPDSPVHALLEGVLADHVPPSAEPFAMRAGMDGGRGLDGYQRIVAQHWKQCGTDLASLQEQHGRCPFGSRAIGFYCLDQVALPANADRIARNLYDHEQYDLANQIYERLEQTLGLKVRQMVRYGSSLSEADQTEKGALRGLERVEKAIQAAESRLTAADATSEDFEAAFHAYCSRSGLQFWIWQLTQSSSALQDAIDSMNNALSYAAKATAGNDTFSLGRLAQAHLKLLLMLRLSEGNTDRDDTEGHAGDILRLRPSPHTPPVGVSYLQWYQAIVWADMCNEKNAHELTIRRVRDDAKIMDEPDCIEIGRRQYSQLRRFIEQYSTTLRNANLIGHISQALQSSL